MSTHCLYAALKCALRPRSGSSSLFIGIFCQKMLCLLRFLRFLMLINHKHARCLCYHAPAFPTGFTLIPDRTCLRSRKQPFFFPLFYSCSNMFLLNEVHRGHVCCRVTASRKHSAQPAIKTRVRDARRRGSAGGRDFTNNDFIAAKNAAYVRVMAVTQATVGGADP